MPQKNIINTQDSLYYITAEAKKRDAVALDTEFVWERTYYPQLGLVQLALSDDECYLIDPLAVDNLQPLGELLACSNVVKIFHDAPQDLMILAQATGMTPQNIFDTRLAAGFAEFPSTLSLATLIKELLEIELDKSASRTNWMQRPLSEQQLIYAANDVRYLRAVRVLLLARITSPEVEQWLKRELALFDNPQSYDFFNPNERYKKMRKGKHLNEAGLHLLKHLYFWREEHARSKNRPRGHIVPDKALLELAEKKPTSSAELKNTQLSAKAVSRYGGQLLEIIGHTDNHSKNREQTKNHYQKKLTKEEKKKLTALSKYIQLKSEVFGIDPALVGNSAELKKIARVITSGNFSGKTRQEKGWRKNFLIDFLK